MSQFSNLNPTSETNETNESKKYLTSLQHYTTRLHTRHDLWTIGEVTRATWNEDIDSRSRPSIRLNTSQRRAEADIDMATSTSLGGSRELRGRCNYRAREDRVGAQLCEVRQGLCELGVPNVVGIGGYSVRVVQGGVQMGDR